MNAIFLDFDGVLNNHQWIENLKKRLGVDYLSYAQRSYEELDPSRVKLISDFAWEVDAKIVLSTSWRILNSIDTLREFLTLAGMPERVLPTETTPIIPKQHRGEEVNLYLGRHPEVSQYVIFDDGTDFYPYQSLVLTTWDGGLCEGHIDLARGILNNKQLGC